MARPSRRTGAAGLLALGLLLAPTAAAESWNRVGVADLIHLVADRTDLRNVYGIDATGGLARTTDAGATWQTLPLAAGTITAVATAIGDSAIVFAVASTQFWASTDAGQSWTLRYTSLPTVCPRAPDPSLVNCPAGSLLVDPTTPDRIMAGSSIALRRSFNGTVSAIAYGWGLVKSVDGGRSWAPHAQFPTSEAFSLATSPDGNVVFAPGVAGFAISRDKGTRWKVPEDPPVVDDPRSGAVAFSSSNPCRVLVTERGATPTVMSTPDCGVSWSPLSRPIVPGKAKVELLVPSATNPDTVYAIVSGMLLKSRDFGVTWSAMCQPPGAVLADMVRIDLLSDRFLVANRGTKDVWIFDAAAPQSQGTVRCVLAPQSGPVDTPVRVR